MARRKRQIIKGTISLIAMVACFAASYGLAVAGEPSSRWFWEQILGRSIEERF